MLSVVRVTQGNARAFSLGQTLLLYAVLVHQINRTHNLPRRIRVLRNLIEASGDEVRTANMPKLVDEVERYTCEGSLNMLTTFAGAQVDDERAKADFLADNY
jgi:hypothetical protein